MAEQGKPENGSEQKDTDHPGMMGDGTEEQNLNQPGNPAARISEAEVKEAFQDENQAGKGTPSK
jgi:hypothetical protein